MKGGVVSEVLEALFGQELIRRPDSKLRESSASLYLLRARIDGHIDGAYARRLRRAGRILGWCA